MRITIILLILFAITPKVKSQQYPTNYFRSPIDFKILLSGSFAELRSNHFHSGIDIKTQGVEGKIIYACADGFVSRIAVSPFGFGKALYIDHPNGFTTVYAHLKTFNSKIEKYVKHEQYKQKEFSVNLFLEPNAIKVKKGEIIAYSGNSGSSGGPHLHFEIRKTSNQSVINPSLFEFNIIDNLSPNILGLRIYAEDSESVIEDNATTKEYKIEKKGKNFVIQHDKPIYCKGKISFALNTFDLANDSYNKNGISKIELWVNSEKKFCYDASRFSFDETKYINSLIDYSLFVKSKRRFIRTKIDPNNKLSMYEKGLNGIVNIVPNKIYNITISVYDHKNNKSYVALQIIGKEINGNIKQKIGVSNNFKHNVVNQFSNANVKITAPLNTFYDDINFEYRSKPATQNLLSAIHFIHNEFTPIHSPIDLSIKYDDNTNVNKENLIIVKLANNGSQRYVGGKIENGFISVKIKELGVYAVMADTIIPTIEPIFVPAKNSKNNFKMIKIKIKDNLSGISKYEAFINEKWVLMEYDPKNNLLIYYFDEFIKKGNNGFVLNVFDNCNNKATYKTNVFVK